MIKKIPRINLAKKETKPKVEVEAKVEEKIGLHNLKVPKGGHERKKILGRGPSSGHGKTSTRGSKGQTSRAGRHFYLGFEGGTSPLIRRMPKRGFVNEFKKEFQLVNLENLAQIKDTIITPEILEKKGIIKDKNKPVKILGDGEIKPAVTIKAHAFSKKAQEKITNSGSAFEIINV